MAPRAASAGRIGDNFSGIRNRKAPRARYASDMSSVLSIAVSGMTAASRRLDVVARNVANMTTNGPLPSAGPDIVAAYPAAYVPKRVDQVETPGGGTRAIVRDVSPAYVALPDPDAPYADADGLVAAPNTDFVGNAVELLIARYTFAANAQVVRSYSQMMKSLLDITA
jgi:flagellar basal-body rod protein FlgC